MTEEANGNQQAASTDNGVKSPEIDYEAKYKEAVAHSREWEKRAKDNKAAADELQQLKEAQLSEAEKTAKRIKELEAKNAAYEAEKQQNEWKTQVSKETGVPIGLLHGSTLEEMQANGKTLADYVRERSESVEHGVFDGTVGTEGTTPGAGKGNLSIDQMIAAAEAKDDTNKVATLKAMMLSAKK